MRNVKINRFMICRFSPILGTYVRCHRVILFLNPDLYISSILFIHRKAMVLDRTDMASFVSYLKKVGITCSLVNGPLGE